MDSTYAQNYERLYRHHWWWRSRERFLVELLRKTQFPRDGNVLDIGCGGGWSFDVLSQFGHEVSGVENDEALVAAGGSRREQIYCGPFDRSFQPNKTFNLIVMLDVLEHMAQPQLALDYAAELLVPDGRLVITVPAMPLLWTSHDDLNHHFIRYTKSTLRPVIENAGLNIDRMQYFFHWLVPLKLAVRFKESMVSTKPQSPQVPKFLVNAMFQGLSRVEQKLLTRVPIPIGSSLLCVARRSENRRIN